MELRDIRYFVVAAEQRNIGRAAEVLGLSATALSKSLRRLESSVGAKLVNRVGRGIKLTAVGQDILERMGPLQAMFNDIRHAAANLAQGLAGHLHIGTAAGAAEHLVADACQRLSIEASRICIKVSVLDPELLLRAVQKGEIDFFVGHVRSAAVDGVAHDILYEDADVVFASAAHRLAKFKQVTLEDLAQERWALTSSSSLPLLNFLTQAFHRKGLATPLIGMDTNSQVVRIPAIASAGYVAFSSRELLRREAQKYALVELPVNELHHSRSLAIVHRKDGYCSPAAGRLIALLKQQALKISANRVGTPAPKPGKTIRPRAAQQ